MSKSSVSAIARCILVFVLLCSRPALADGWPQWLGPERDSVWRETGILDSFPEGGPSLRWRQKIGGGYAGPAVADGRVFVADRLVDSSQPIEKPEKADSWTRVVLPGEERLLCLRESDGEILWEYRYDCPYSIAYNFAIGPRVTPTVDGNRVYHLGAEGDLVCLSVEDGDVLWQCSFRRDYSLEAPVWGWASHPLVDGDKLVCVVGGQGSTAVAFNKMTGKELWRSLSSKEPGYSAPVIYNVHGRRQLIIWHGEALSGLNPETGEVSWTVPTEAFSGMSIGTPRLWEDYMYVMAYNGFGAMVRLDAGSPMPTASVAWRAGGSRGITGSMNTPFLMDGYIYGDGKNGRYACVDIATGKRCWTSYQASTGTRPAPWANVFTVSHDERFFLANDLGDLIIANMNPDGFEEVSRAHLIEPTHQVWGRMVVWSHPAFANRSVYLRNDEEIACYSLAAKPGS